MGPLTLVVPLAECFAQFEPGRPDMAGVQVVHPPGGIHGTMQIPGVSLKTVLQDPCGFRWAPNLVGPGDTVKIGAEKSVETRHMVHVQMRKKQVVDGLEVSEGKGGKATLTAIKQQPGHLLPGIHLGKNSVVSTRGSQNLE